MSEAQPVEPVTTGPAAGPAVEAVAGPKKKRGYLVPGLIALVALALMALAINYWGLSHTTPRTLHGDDVATLVSQGLQAQEGDASPPQVSCPDHEPLKAGLVFHCTLHKGSSSLPIQVTETDGSGDLTYKVLAAS